MKCAGTPLTLQVAAPYLKGHVALGPHETHYHCALGEYPLRFRFGFLGTDGNTYGRYEATVKYRGRTTYGNGEPCYDPHVEGTTTLTFTGQRVRELQESPQGPLRVRGPL